MLLPYDLPSIKRFAASLWDELEKGDLVIICRPETRNGEIWLGTVLDAFDSFARQKGDLLPTRLTGFRGECPEPTAALATALNLPETSTISELLECFGRESTCILTVDCREGLSSDWRALFLEIGRIYRTTGMEVRCRPILAVLVGCEEFPPITQAVGIRCKALWNAVRWEEIRLLTESMLPSNENALVRAWRIATYSASSNCNPDLVAQLCRDMPNSLSEAVEYSLNRLGCNTATNFEPVAPFVADQRWNVPPSVVQQWAAGQILEVSLERGTNFNLKHMTREKADAYLHTAIWREQVSGLFPTVMEMGFLVNNAVTNAVGRSWLDGISQQAHGPGGSVYLEPGEVIDRLNGLPVPNILREMLRSLRETRNDLAHMRPVDHGRVRKLWGRYDRIRRKFSSPGTPRKERK